MQIKKKTSPDLFIRKKNAYLYSCFLEIYISTTHHE
jgi:hypothetical protein